MAYKALYRKYRPQTFSDVCGQDHIVETLKSELSAGKISHAYLFTGTRGTGKTSCAKILAKAINCLSPVSGDPCLECEACRMVSADEATDIAEIDAASNNGVDDVRVLREQIAFTPTVLKYRVYIIDEVHMLSPAAFNALLKTLEEPPEYAVFILATTEVHKLPATILSRCQRFDFKRIEADVISARINYIAEKEGFTVTERAAALIAAAADGGMRDALSILDLCVSASDNITEEIVTEVCGMSGYEYLNRMSDAIIKRDTSAALLLTDELYNGSVDMLRLANDLSAHFRDIMVVKTVSSENKPIVCSREQLAVYKEKAGKFDIKDVMRCLNMLSECIASMQNANRRSVFEMTVIRMCSPELCTDILSLEKRVRALEDGRFAVPTSHKSEPVTAPDEELPPPPEPNEAAQAAPEQGIASDERMLPEWGEILNLLETSSPALRGVLNGSKAYLRGQYLLIDAPNDMFRDFINGSSSGLYRDAIRKAAMKVTGSVYKLGPYKPKEQNSEDPLKAFAEQLKQFDIN